MDFRPMLSKHKKSGNEVSVIYTHVSNAKEEYINCDSLNVEEGQVTGIGINAGKNKIADISLETFILNRKAFNDIIALSRSISSIYSFRQMVEYVCKEGIYKLGAIEFSGYIAPILTFENYVKYSFELLDYSKRSQLFNPNWPIYTTSHNTPPALYGEDAVVSNSFVANGSRIHGTVKNSVISRDVIVEEGAVVENCILFTRTKIGKDAKVKNVVTDKHAKIINSKDVQGDPDNMMFVDFGEII
jgi:glucose-1-phosphate adenylyltransferase